MAKFYRERSKIIPARTSRPPTTAMTPTSVLGCEMLSTFMVFVTARNVKIKTTNPVSDRKPPRAILKRCLRVKCDIAFFSHHNVYSGKITLSLVKTPSKQKSVIPFSKMGLGQIHTRTIRTAEASLDTAEKVSAVPYSTSQILHQVATMNVIDQR